MKLIGWLSDNSLMKRPSDMTLVEVAGEFGVRSYGAVAGRATGFT